MFHVPRGQLRHQRILVVFLVTAAKDQMFRVIIIDVNSIRRSMMRNIFFNLCAVSCAFLQTFHLLHSPKCAFIFYEHFSWHAHTNKLYIVCITTLCPRKKRDQNVFVISLTKFGQLWWNLVHSFLKKIALKSCKRFPPRLNTVSTLPCETWNAHRAHATIELLDKLQNLSNLNCGFQIRQIWI